MEAQLDLAIKAVKASNITSILEAIGVSAAQTGLFHTLLSVGLWLFFCYWNYNNQKKNLFRNFYK